MSGVQGWSEDELETRAAPLARLVRRVWRAISKALSARLTGQSTISFSDAADVTQLWSQSVDEQLIAYVHKTYLDAAGNVASAVGLESYDQAIGEDLAAAHLATVRNRLVGIGQDVWEVVSRQITLGNQAGESVKQIAARVRNVTGVSDARSLVIARTEVHAAHEAGSYAQALYVGGGTKTWLATEDSHTRETHRKADGQRVAVAEQFQVGATTLRYPGDPLGEPGETISCRCSVAYEFGDIISGVSTDDEAPSDATLAFVAAGKWQAHEHPRGKGGKFIKKGDVQSLLAAKKPTIAQLFNAVDNLDQEQWDQLTETQQEFITDKLDALPGVSTSVTSKKAKLKILAKNSLQSPAPMIANVDVTKYKTGEVIAQATNGDVIEKTQGGTVTYLDADGSILYSESDAALVDLVQNVAPNETWTVTPPAGEKMSDTSTSAKTGGEPLKITTSLIWGKHTPGTVIADASDEVDTYVEWDGKKYAHVVKGEQVALWTKKDAYANLKNDKHWVTPLDQKSVAPPAMPAAPTGGKDVPAKQLSAEELLVGFDELAPQVAGVLGTDMTLKELKKLVVDTTHSHNTVIGTRGNGLERLRWDAEDNSYVLDRRLTADHTWLPDKVVTKLRAIIKLRRPEESWRVPQDLFVATQAPKSKMTLADFTDVEQAAWKVYDEKGTQANSIAESWQAVQAAKASLNAHVSGSSVSDADIVELLDKMSEVVYDVSPGFLAAMHSPELALSTQISSPVLPESKISNWPGVTDVEHQVGDVVAVADSGSYVLKANSSGGFDLVGAHTGSFINSYTKEYIQSGAIEDHVPNWHVPPVSLNQPKPPPDDAGVPVVQSSVFAIGLAQDTTGEIVAVGSLKSGFDASYRLLTAKSYTGKNALELQVKSSSDDWSSLGTYKSLDEFEGDWTTNSFSWYTYAPIDMASPTDGGDISDVGYLQKLDFKNKLKAANVGYWSKPEKIWTVIQEIQKSWPQHGDTSQSQFTPLQIIKSLDSLTNTTTPSPYETKMVKWAGSTKGQAYIAAGGGTPSITPTQPVAPVSMSELVPSGLSNFPTVTTENVNVTYTLKNNPKISNAEIFAKIFTAPQGTVLAYGREQYGTRKYRLVVSIDDMGAPALRRQVMLPGGTWSSGNVNGYGTLEDFTYATQYTVPDGQWTTAENAKIITTKKATKSLAPPVKVITPSQPAAGQLDLGTGDISHLTGEKKQTLYTTFKKQPSTYLDSPPSDIYAALSTIAADHGLSTLQLIRVIDEVGAQKVGKPDEHLFEKKIKDWLKTPHGAAIASGKPIPVPETPKFTSGVDPTKIQSLATSNTHKYDIVSVNQANLVWQDMIKKHGTAWTAAQKAALRTYTGGTFYSMNAYLYGKLDSVSATHMKSIAQAQLGMRPSDRPLLLHRGVNYNGIANAKSHEDLVKQVGATWKSPGFFSTSVAGKAAFHHHAVSIEVEAPPGTPMAWLEPISQYKDNNENEMLLAAGLHYKIMSVKKVGSKTVVRVRVVPTPTPEVTT